MLRTVPAETAMSIIGPGMRITGELETEGTVRIEGSIDGTVRAGRSVVVGKDGEVIGDVYTQEAVIGGRVAGTVTAESRVELQSSCIIEGEIWTRTRHLQLAEGAQFSGRIHMIEEGEEPMAALPAETGTTTEVVAATAEVTDEADEPEDFPQEEESAEVKY